MGRDRQAGIEDEFPRQSAGALPPAVDEGEQCVVLVRLAHAGVRLDEQPGIGIAGEKGEDAFLPAAALGDIVLFDRCIWILAVPGDGMEVEVEGAVDASGILGQGGTFRQGVQPGEQSDTGIEEVGHPRRRPSDPP